jgi:cytoskeleton-associated protein 5
MDDSNIAVKLLCLRIISKIATGMGQPFQAHARLFSSPIATICGDQKVTTRNAAVETLTSIADACRSIDAMVPGFASSLEKPNPVLRGCVLAFVASMFANYAPKSDLAPLLPSTLASLEDRNGDVRKAAQALLPFILQSVGYDHVMGQVSKLKPASKSTVTPLVQAARAALAASAPETSPEEIKPATKSVETKQPATRPAARSVLTESNSVSTSMGSQPTLPSAGGSAATPLRARVEPVRPRGMQMKNNALRAPGATLPDSSDHRLPAPTRSLAGGAAGLVRSLGKRPTAPVAEMPLQDSATAAPFHTTDIAPKTQREKRDLARWTYDVNNLSPLVENLQKQMTDHASAEVLTLLFSRDRFAEKDHTAGLAIIDDLYSAEEDDSPFDLVPEVAQSIRIANRDLALKYAGIRLHDGSTQMVIKCLDLVQHIVESVDRARAGFTEAEGNVIVPALIYRVSGIKIDLASTICL